MIYDRKVICCGNVLELYEYKEPIKSGYKNKIDKKKREQTIDVKLENFHRSIKRTKTKIRHLVNTNYVPGKSSFLTVTFKDNITDYDVAFSFWKRFKQMVERKYDKKLSYCGVVEFQERGSIHFHICLFNVGFMAHSELYTMWNKVTNGGVHIQAIEDEAKGCDNVGAYITKYLSKDNIDFFDNQYKGKKRYFKSRDLKEPEVVNLDSSYLEQKEYYDNFVEDLKENIVFEYTSKEFEIKRKIHNVEYAEFEEVTNEVFEEGRKLYVEIKKESFDEVVGVQQLTYKQIILEKNKYFR